MHKNCKKVFNFNDFCTKFSSKGDNDIEYGRRACFDMLVSEHRQVTARKLIPNDITTNTYKVFVSFVDLGNNYNNCCFLSKEELEEWIKDMQKFAVFEFNLEDFKKGCEPEYQDLDEGDGVFVNLTFKDRPFAEHFLVLEMIKHTYEFGFSWCVYQAVKLRDIINKDELMINIHNLIFCCNYGLVVRSCSDHTLLTTVYYALPKIHTERDNFICYLPTAEDIKQRIPLTYSIANIFNPIFMKNEEIGMPNLQKLSYLYNSKEYDIYQDDHRVQETFKITNDIEYVKQEEPNALKYFDSYFEPSKCKERLDCYIKTYEKLKQYGKQ